MPKKITLLLSGFDTGKSRLNIKTDADEFGMFFSSIVKGILNENLIKSNRIVFFHTCHFKNKDNIDMSSIFFKVITEHLKNKIAICQILSSDDDEFKEKAASWKNTEHCLDQRNALINIFSKEQKCFFEDYYLGKEEDKLGATVIHIDTYFDCNNLLSDLIDQELGHLIIYKFIAGKCFSDTFWNGSLSYKNKFLSLTIISDDYIKDQENINLTPIMHYFFRRDFIQIFKSDDPSLLERRISHWVKLYFYSPSCFFSYAEENGVHSHMSLIESNIRQYFNFLKIERDKTNDNLYMNLEDYQDRLAKGDMVFCILSKKYLERFHPMYELVSTLENKRLLMDEEYTSVYTEYKKAITRTFSGAGFLVIIHHDAAEDYIYNDNNNLKNKWYEIVNENKKDKKFKQSDVEKIYNNIENIKNFLKSLYNHKSADDHIMDAFRGLAWEIKKIISKHENDYFDIYQRYTEDSFPYIKSRHNISN